MASLTPIRSEAHARSALLRGRRAQSPAQPILAAPAAFGGHRLRRGGQRFDRHRHRGHDRRPAHDPDPRHRLGGSAHRRQEPAADPSSWSILGAAAVVGLAWIMGLFVPYPVVAATNSQVAARVTPRIIDLVAALATGAVGSVALARSDVSDTLPGVAIAISLVPPLAVVGLTLESGAPHQALGALLLFTTNVAAILASGIVVMALYRTHRISDQAQAPAFHRRGAVAVVAIIPDRRHRPSDDQFRPDRPDQCARGRRPSRRRPLGGRRPAGAWSALPPRAIGCSSTRRARLPRPTMRSARGPCRRRTLRGRRGGQLDAEELHAPAHVSAGRRGHHCRVPRCCWNASGQVDGFGLISSGAARTVGVGSVSLGGAGGVTSRLRKVHRLQP